MPICPGKFRSVLAVVPVAVLTGEVWAQAHNSYGLDTAPASTVVAQSDSQNSYGLDTVSDSGFHEEVWNRYGSDPTPRVTTDAGHFRRVAPHPLPAVRNLNAENLDQVARDHVALYRAIQHLTGAVEMTPGPEQPAPKAVPPKKKAAEKAIEKGTGNPTAKPAGELSKPSAAPRPLSTSPTSTAPTPRRWRLFGR